MTENDLDLEISKISFRHWVDCPHCGNVIDFGEHNPDGEVVECEDCTSRFRASQ